MKKLFSTLTLTVCLGAFISCTNDEQEVNMVKPTNANSVFRISKQPKITRNIQA